MFSALVAGGVGRPQAAAASGLDLPTEASETRGVSGCRRQAGRARGDNGARALARSRGYGPMTLRRHPVLDVGPGRNVADLP